MKHITKEQRDRRDRNRGIIALYTSGMYTTEQIANNYNVTPKTVQRICKHDGVLRTAAESNKLIAPLKKYRTIPSELRVKRKSLTNKLRYTLIASHPYCTHCGMKPDDGVRLEIDHIDNNPSNNDKDNLQVLCTLCNIGKSHLDRFGS